MPWGPPRIVQSPIATTGPPDCQGESRPGVHSKSGGQGEIRTDSDDRFHAFSVSVDADR